jgi:hypothetical protein
VKYPAIGICRSVIEKLIAEDHRSDQQRARYGTWTSSFARAVRWVEDEADLMANVLRSLIAPKF